MSTTGKVLIVDDEENLRGILSMFFEFEGWTTVEAHNGMKAQTELEKDSFDLIVSDISMPIVDGLELLEFAKGKFPEIKFILTTGNAEIIQSIDAHNKGADNFLAKPFDSKKLHEVVDKTLNPPTEVELMEIEQNFVDVPIDDFYSARTLLSDIYIKLGVDRRLKIANCGEEVPKERFETYSSKGITHLSIPKEDFGLYVKFNMRLAGALKNTTKISNRVKAKQLSHTIEAALTESMVGNPDKDMILQSKLLVLSMSDNLLQTSEHFNLLQLMKDHSPALFSHSVGVALYSTLISEKLGWTSTRTKGMLAMAGLYHDIGKKEIPAELVEKPRSQFTFEERQLWETHAARGRDILNDLGGIPSEVTQAVSQHHHYLKSTDKDGYAFSGSTVHPYAEIIALVDFFCNYCLKNPNQVYSVKESFVRIVDYHLEDVNKVHLVAFMKVMNIEVPPALTKEATKIDK